MNITVSVSAGGSVEITPDAGSTVTVVQNAPSIEINPEITPQGVALALISMSISDRRSLANALLAALPDISAGDALPDADLPAWNGSSILIKVQP